METVAIIHKGKSAAAVMSAPLSILAFRRFYGGVVAINME